MDFIVSGEFGLLARYVDAGVVGDGVAFFGNARPEDGAAGLVGEVGKDRCGFSVAVFEVLGLAGGVLGQVARGEHLGEQDNAATFHGCAFDEGYGMSQVAGLFAWNGLHLDKINVLHCQNLITLGP